MSDFSAGCGITIDGTLGIPQSHSKSCTNMATPVFHVSIHQLAIHQTIKFRSLGDGRYRWLRASCSNSIANILALLQSCAKPSIQYKCFDVAMKSETHLRNNASEMMVKIKISGPQVRLKITLHPYFETWQDLTVKHFYRSVIRVPAQTGSLGLGWSLLCWYLFFYPRFLHCPFCAARILSYPFSVPFFFTSWNPILWNKLARKSSFSCT